jgi:hypothetical protein
MINAYRSDTIREQHRDEYDNDRRASKALADCIKCPPCSTEYSFFFVAEQHSPELVRTWAQTVAKYEHPEHTRTCIRVPENRDEADKQFGYDVVRS